MKHFTKTTLEQLRTLVIRKCWDKQAGFRLVVDVRWECGWFQEGDHTVREGHVPTCDYVNLASKESQ